MNGKHWDWGSSLVALAVFSLPVVVGMGFVMLVVIDVLEMVSH